MARKRAPGGGRKPKGPTPMRSQLTVRMPDDLRAELEMAAQKRGRNLTDELIGRLRRSFSREREERRDPAMRALCHLISEMGRRNLRTGRSKKPAWHRDRFTFRAFKLALAQMLDALEPSGEIRPPTDMTDMYGRPFQTPEALAKYAAADVLYGLFHSEPLTREHKAMLLEDYRQLGIPELLPEFERELYAFADARRDLQRRTDAGEG